MISCWRLFVICQLVEFKTPPYRSHNVELVSKGARSCLRVANMKEEDFGGMMMSSVILMRIEDDNQKIIMIIIMITSSSSLRPVHLRGLQHARHWQRLHNCRRSVDLLWML